MADGVTSQDGARLGNAHVRCITLTDSHACLRMIRNIAWFQTLIGLMNPILVELSNVCQNQNNFVNMYARF